MASFSSVRLATFDEPVFPRCKKRSSFFWPMAGRRESCSSGHLAAVRRYCRSCTRASWRSPAPSEGARAGRGFSPRVTPLFLAGPAYGRGRIHLFVPMGHSVAGGRDGQQQLLRSESERIRAMGFASDDVLRLCPPGSMALAPLGIYGKGRRAAAERGAGSISFAPQLILLRQRSATLLTEELGVQNAAQMPGESLVARACWGSPILSPI